jgi:hypothetical protein
MTTVPGKQCPTAMRVLVLTALALTAQLTFGTDEIAKTNKLKWALVKAKVTQEMLKTLTYDGVPDEWRTKVEDQSTERFTKKVFWRGNDKVLEVLWSKDWTGTRSNMFVATVYDGRRRIGRIDRSDGTTDVTQPKDARVAYNMTTMIKTNGLASVMFSSDGGYLQVVKVSGRDTHLMDDIEYTRFAVGVEQIGGPLFEALDEIRKRPSK